MDQQPPDHALEFLLAFDGRIHYLEDGYWLKFEIRRVESTPGRPHGLRYSFTLHAPSGARLVGFDNAHFPPAHTGPKPRGTASDHWHRTQEDPGRRYRFKDVETLIDDFFDEVERVLEERGIASRVIRVDELRRRK
jgi:Family of unknown function (DUF6516)